MKIYFKTRSKARAVKSGKLADNGKAAPVGKRWSRELPRKVTIK
jgi:hypothetical protein